MLRSLAGLELARLVRAVTEIETELTKEVKPVLFEVGGTTILNLAIFAPPRNIDIAPASPSNDPRPTFTWTPPATGDFTGDVVGFEVRIVPDQTAFKDVGNVTSFTPGISDFPDPGIPDGPHTFQVRAVGTEDRKDAVGSLDFVITLITPPILVAPADNALLTTRTPFFDWEASTEEVDVYLLQVTSGDINGESLDIDVAIPGITTQFAVPTVAALAPAEYRWRVIARDVSLNTASSVTRTFTILPAGVGLRLESESAFVRVGTPFDVAIKVEPNLLPVSTITAFLDFNTADLEVLNIREGVTLEVVLVSSFDNSQGTVDFGATTLGQPVIGDFVLAVVTFVSNNEEVTSETTVSFSEEFPRKTDAVVQGDSFLGDLVPADFTILKPTVDMRLKLQVDGLEWGRMAIVDTKPFKLRVILHRIFVERPQVTGIPAWPGGAACYRRSRYIL